MSLETAKTYFDNMNVALARRYDSGNPVKLAIDGHPDLRILSFDPLAYLTYQGYPRTNAPRLVGEVALRSLLHATAASNDIRVCVAVEAGSEVYGFMMRAGVRDWIPALDEVSQRLGQGPYPLHFTSP